MLWLCGQRKIHQPRALHVRNAPGHVETLIGAGPNLEALNSHILETASLTNDPARSETHLGIAAFFINKPPTQANQ